MFGAKYNHKLIFLGILLSVMVVLCGVDHVLPMNGAGHHAHPSSPTCNSNLCITKTSQGAPLSGKTAVVLLLLVVFGDFRFGPRLSDPDPNHRALLVNKDHLPGASNKLYRLHAAYLL
jgi:hypothetical protein